MKHHSFKNALASALLALIVTSPALSFGAPQGGTDGGGGNAIVCFSDKSIPKQIYANDNPNRGVITQEMLASIISVETYDLAYAKLATLERKPQIIPIQDKETFEQYARRIGKRVYSDSPRVLQMIERGLSLLKLQKALIRETGVITVSDIADVGVVDTSSCVVSTMAVQQLGATNPLNIDGRLFQHPKHTRQSMAILMLHEILYAAARQDYGARDSSGVRELIRVIATEGAGYTRPEFNQLLAKSFPLAPIRQKDNYGPIEFDHRNDTIETILLFNKVQPMLAESNRVADAFLESIPELGGRFVTAKIWDWDRYSVYMCAADSQMKAQANDLKMDYRVKKECTEYLEDFEYAFEKNSLTFKNLLNDFHSEHMIDLQRYNVDKIWASGLAAEMKKYGVREDVQELLKKKFVEKLERSGILSRFDRNLSWRFEFWQELDSEMRNAVLELP